MVDLVVVVVVVVRVLEEMGMYGVALLSEINILISFAKNFV